MVAYAADGAADVTADAAADEVEMQLGDSPEEIECKKICKAEYDDCIAQWRNFQNCWIDAILDRAGCRRACTNSACGNRCTREFNADMWDCRERFGFKGVFEPTWKYCDDEKANCNKICDKEGD